MAAATLPHLLSISSQVSICMSIIIIFTLWVKKSVFSLPFNYFNKKPYAIIWMFVSSQNSSVEILTPNMIVLGGETLGRCLGHKGGALVNGISVVIKETPQSFLAPSIVWGHGEKAPSMNEELDPRQTPNCWHGVDLGLPSLQNYEKQISFVYRTTVYGILLEHLEQIKTT